MKKQIISLLLSLLLLTPLVISASAAAWNAPEKLEEDGGIYYTYNNTGFVTVWETPEQVKACASLNNGSELVVECRTVYTDNCEWGRVTLENAGEESITGWVPMSDLVGENVGQVKTFNNAVTATAAIIAAVAVFLVAAVLVKHKAVNKKK